MKTNKSPAGKIKIKMNHSYDDAPSRNEKKSKRSGHRTESQISNHEHGKSQLSKPPSQSPPNQPKLRKKKLGKQR
jgi:uncharacterized protein (DUF302 family)